MLGLALLTIGIIEILLAIWLICVTPKRKRAPEVLTVKQELTPEELRKFKEDWESMYHTTAEHAKIEPMKPKGSKRSNKRTHHEKKVQKRGGKKPR